MFISQKSLSQRACKFMHTYINARTPAHLAHETPSDRKSFKKSMLMHSSNIAKGNKRFHANIIFILIRWDIKLSGKLMNGNTATEKKTLNKKLFDVIIFVRFYWNELLSKSKCRLRIKLYQIDYWFIERGKMKWKMHASIHNLLYSIVAKFEIVKIIDFHLNATNRFKKKQRA